MSNKVIQCKQCGRLFMFLGTYTCPACVEKLEKDFKKVKDYIYEHPEQSIAQISEGTDVPEKVVLHFLKEGWLSINDPSSLECERCGKPISQGRFCSVCSGVLEKALNSVCPPTPSQEKTKTGSSLGKMHFDYRSKL